MKKFNPDGILKPETYWTGVELEEGERLVVSSGLVGHRIDGSVPEDPAEQIDLAWKNVVTFLNGAGLSVENLVKVRMMLSDRAYIPISTEARTRILGPHFDAAVVLSINGLYSEEYILEIELYAAIKH